MEEKRDEHGRRYIKLSPEDKEKLPPDTMIATLPSGDEAIPPNDCEHDFVMVCGIPKNTLVCKKCIYQTMTDLPFPINGVLWDNLLDYGDGIDFNFCD